MEIPGFTAIRIPHSTGTAPIVGPLYLLARYNLAELVLHDYGFVLLDDEMAGAHECAGLEFLQLLVAALEAHFDDYCGESG